MSAGGAWAGALAAVALGGFLGGLARWGLSRAPGGLAGTWLANVTASAVLGAAAGLSGLWPLCVGTGFAGALSTWSTLAKEIGQMLTARQVAKACGYAAATALAGVLAALGGLALGSLAG